MMISDMSCVKKVTGEIRSDVALYLMIAGECRRAEAQARDRVKTTLATLKVG
jgi:hypothetical protein